jgi:hypothetical protein
MALFWIAIGIPQAGHVAVAGAANDAVANAAARTADAITILIVLNMVQPPN